MNGFNTIVAPLLKGETSYSSRDACKFAAAELDSCLQLLGEQHYMYTNLKARKLYMDAMALTWAFSQSEYNISIKPVIEKALRLLEESESLEPNAAYTLQQSGILYCDIFDYEKAYPKFQKYLDLRPNDFYSKYSLATIYTRLGKFEKAEELFQQLIREYPDNVDLYTGLSDAYMNDNKKNEGLKWAKKIVDVLHDKFTGYFAMGVCYSYSNQVDSAAYYYKLSAKQTKDCPACYNNIGHIYFLNNKTDSAIKYFQLVLKRTAHFRIQISIWLRSMLHRAITIQPFQNLLPQLSISPPSTNVLIRICNCTLKRTTTLRIQNFTKRSKKRHSPLILNISVIYPFYIVTCGMKH
ncbi:MAG: tetratricopeptide repeat protein [Chitinophagaceae bacterium]|nr:tetratricopeptide repeat protein [Chitinophagaceae bacterium]